MKKIVQWFGLFSPAAPASLFIAVYIFLFLPLELLENNRYFVNHGFNAIFPMLVLFAVPVYLLLAIPALGGQKKWHPYYAAIMTGAAITLFVASLFLSTTTYIPERFIVALFIAFVVLGYYKSKLTKQILILMSCCFMLLTIQAAIRDHQQGFLGYQEAKEALGSFSKKKNMLVIMLDAFQSDFFQEILKRRPTWAAEFSGFTYYPHAAAVGPVTYLSMPSIHSGRVYTSKENVAQFYKEEVENKSFMKELQNNGYRAVMVNPYMGYSPPHIARIDENYFSSIQSGVVHDACVLLNLSFLNSLPVLAHWWSKVRPLTSSNSMLSILASNITATSPRPTIKFLHLYDSHHPAKYDQNCQRIDRPTWSRLAAINQDQCAVSRLINVLNTLKQQALYDQTAILIIADHGTGFPPDINESAMGAYANPLMLFKPFSKKGVLITSERRTSLIDIKNIVCATTNDCSTIYPTLDKLMSTFDKQRRLPFNMYQTISGYLDAIRVFTYELSGSPRDNASWTKLVPAGFVHQLSIVDDVFQEYAGVGWGPAEPGGRWIFGQEADLFLPLEPGKEAMLRFSTNTFESIQNQQLSVWVNNHFIEKFSIVAETNNLIAFRIPKELITHQPTHVVFRLNNSTPITDIGLSVSALFFGHIQIS